MYQPKYPLKFDEINGAYASIRDLKDTVKQNVVTLLNVSPGEWPGNPEIGVGIRRFLFANYPSPEILEVHQKIKDQFSRYLPFLDVRSEFIDKDEAGNSLVDLNEIKLVIRYNITPIAEEDLLTLRLGESPQ